MVILVLTTLEKPIHEAPRCTPILLEGKLTIRGPDAETDDTIEQGASGERAEAESGELGMLRQLFEEAEAQEIELELDLAVVEDEVMLKEVEKISMDAPTRERKKKAVKLDSMRDEHQRLMLENERLRSELKGTRSRADELEGKAREQRPVCLIRRGFFLLEWWWCCAIPSYYVRR